MQFFFIFMQENLYEALYLRKLGQICPSKKIPLKTAELLFVQSIKS